MKCQGEGKILERTAKKGLIEKVIFGKDLSCESIWGRNILENDGMASAKTETGSW